MASRITLISLAMTFLALGIASAVSAGDWEPQRFADVETIELRTVGPEEGEYWFKVWVVVIDDQAYVRLGSTAAERMRNNVSGTQIGVRVGELQFDHVRTEEAPDLADRVADAMADKYWSDIFIRFFPHPMTLRLVVDDSEAGEKSSE